MKFLFFLFFSLSSLLFALDIQVVTEEWRPYNYTEEGVLKGISTEIVTATLDEAGLTGNFTVYPWSRAYHISLNEPNTLIYTIFRNQEREGNYFWIGPINQAPRHYLFKLKDREDIQLNTLEDAKPYMVGVLKNNYTHQKLMEEGFQEGINLEVNNTTEANIRMLLAGRIDLFPGDEIATKTLIKAMNISEDQIVKTLQIFETEARAYMALNRYSSEALVARIREAFIKVRDSGLIDKVTDKYLQGYY